MDTVDNYRRYHESRPADRNDLIRNPEVLFQVLASQRALWRALRTIGFTPGQRVVEIGGGSGGSLVQFMEVGCPIDTLVSLDNQAVNAEIGRKKFPGMKFITADGASTGLDRASFDVVFSSTMFGRIPDLAVAQSIGTEMRRIAKPGGHIIVRDWNFGDPRDSDSIGVTHKRIREIFGLPIAHTESGSMTQPVGRRISRFALALYFLLQPLCPLGLRVYVMKV